MQKYQFLPALQVDTRETFAKNLTGKRLFGIREEPFWSATIQENKRIKGTYDVLITDGKWAWDLNRPILLDGIPIAAKVIEDMTGGLIWEIKEVPV
jgi:hypothetical protein